MGAPLATANVQFTNAIGYRHDIVRDYSWHGKGTICENRLPQPKHNSELLLAIARAQFGNTLGHRQSATRERP